MPDWNKICKNRILQSEPYSEKIILLTNILADLFASHPQVFSVSRKETILKLIDITVIFLKFLFIFLFFQRLSKDFGKTWNPLKNRKKQTSVLRRWSMKKTCCRSIPIKNYKILYTCGKFNAYEMLIGQFKIQQIGKFVFAKFP